jgi:hypothetical protein
LHRYPPQPRFTLPAAESLIRILDQLTGVALAVLTPLRPLGVAAGALLRDAERRTRRTPRLSLGIAAVTVAAARGTLLATTAGSSPAGAAGSLDAISSAARAQPGHPAHPGAAAGHGHGPGAGTRNSGTGNSGTGNSGAGNSGARAPGPARHGAGSAPAASPAPSRQPVVPAAPYLIYDSINPETIPGDHVVATYADGPHPTPVSEVAGRSQVLWIDTVGTDYAASVLDVEPGCATPAAAANWAEHRLSAGPDAVARIYTMLSEWPAVKAAVAGLPDSMQARIHWWIADPNGTPHVVPGSQATQWYWGSSYDISTAEPDF